MVVGDPLIEEKEEENKEEKNVIGSEQERMNIGIIDISKNLAISQESIIDPQNLEKSIDEFDSYIPDNVPNDLFSSWNSSAFEIGGSEFSSSMFHTNSDNSLTEMIKHDSSLKIIRRYSDVKTVNEMLKENVIGGRKMPFGSNCCASIARKQMKIDLCYVDRVDIYYPYIMFWMLNIMIQSIIFFSISFGSISSVNSNSTYLTLFLCNLFIAGLSRFHPFIFLLYDFANWLTKRFPGRSVYFYHKSIHCIGGIHSSCATISFIWLMWCIEMKKLIWLEIIVSILMVAILIVALPFFRENHHNVFELVHRYFGWIALGCTWYIFFKHLEDRSISQWFFLSGFT